MNSLRSLGIAFFYLAAGGCLAVAQSNLPPTEQHGASRLDQSRLDQSWLDRLLQIPLPKFATFVPSYPPAAYSTCAVAGLTPIEEAGAVSFEANAGTLAMIDTTGLTQATASALARLQQMVAAIGGRLELKSAYRPLAYQEHLQAVWDKWKTLRHNRQPGCQILRAEVGDEFARHRLLETQRPVTNSDHTRGVGIDAALILPAGARWKRRRVSLDRLAKMVGFGRPDIRHDPVHFRLLASNRETQSTIATN